MPGRKFSSSSYRYGFNGKENDKEVKGDGLQVDYGFRVYDPRVGKFLSTDPLTRDYPWYTPYQFAGNMPIWAIDLDGLEEKINNKATDLKPGITLISKSQAQSITRQRNNPTTIHHPKDLSSINETTIKQENLRSGAEQVFIGISTQGKVGLNQNPIKNVKETSTKLKETIEDWGSFGKYLKVTSELQTTTVDVSKSGLTLAISEIEVESSKSITYTKIAYENPNGEFGISLNPNESFSQSSSSTLVKLPLNKEYSENLKKLSPDLSKRVLAAMWENNEISERAIKGIIESGKDAEKKANDGKFIPNKGKDYSGENVPKINP